MKNRIATLILAFLVMPVGACSQWTASWAVDHTAVRQGDTTKIVQALAEAEWKSPSDCSFPGELISPELAGKTFTVHISGGKNLVLDLWYADGTHKAHLTSDRSANIDRLYAGALGMDAQKFGFIVPELAQMQAFDQKQIDALVGLIQQAIGIASRNGSFGAGNIPPPTTTPTPGAPISPGTTASLEILSAINRLEQGQISLQTRIGAIEGKVAAPTTGQVTVPGK